MSSAGDLHRRRMTTSELVFDPFSEDFFNGPYELYRRMREEAPVYYNEEYDFYALSRHEDVAVAFKDFETYSSAYGLDLAMLKSDEPPSVKMIIIMDPPEHRHMRSLVNKVFTPRAIENMRPMVTQTIDRYMPTADADHFDVVQDFAALFPVDVITQMLGVPEEYRQKVREWGDISLRREPGQIEMSEEGRHAVVELMGFYYNLIQERRADPQDDMLSRLIAAEVKEDANGETRQLDDVEIAGFATLLGGAGAETVTKLVGNAAVTFARFPDQWQKLLDDRSKIPAAVEELLRYEAPSPVQSRWVARDVELHGVTIPRGARISMLNGSADRDERHFPDPDRFDIHRDIDRQLAFGYGAHFCIGAAVARLEGRVALDETLKRYPTWEIDESRLERIHTSTVRGYTSVPMRVR